MTGEQRYHQAMTKARLVWGKTVSDFLQGNRNDSGEPLYDLQRRLLIEELDRA